MNTPRTLSIGGATYDLFVKTGKDIPEDKEGKHLLLHLGSKIKVEDVVETCGGGASNTSVGLARLGCQASFCGVVGSDQWGERLLKNLQAEGVDTASATVVEHETSSFSIILNTAVGERVILYSPGTNDHLHDANFDLSSAQKADWIYLNHLQESNCIIMDDLIRILSESVNIGLTWNPGGCQLKKGMTEKENAELLRHTDLLLLNEEEALAFTGTQTVEAAMDLLLKAKVKNVCISRGAKGSVASDGKRLYRCPVVKDAKIIDTTGAGDAFGTGATWALLRGKDLPQALRSGTINATSVLGHMGAQAGLLTDIEMEQRLQTTSLDVEYSPLR